MEDYDQIPLVERGEDVVSSTGNNAPSEWRGLPRFVPQAKRFTLVLSFETEEERETMIKDLGVYPSKTTKWVISARWPPTPNEDLSALKFTFPDLDE